MKEINKRIKENTEKGLIKIYDKLDYEYLITRIYQNYCIDYWKNHIFIWKKLNHTESYSLAFDERKNKTKTMIKNKYFYTLTK